MILHFILKTVVENKFKDVDKREAKRQLEAIAVIHVRSHVAPITVIMKMERNLNIWESYWSTSFGGQAVVGNGNDQFAHREVSVDFTI